MQYVLCCLALFSTTFCGLGDEYRAFTRTDYQKQQTAKENFRDVGGGVFSAGTLYIMSHVIEKANHPIAKVASWLLKLFSVGVAQATGTFD